MAHFEVDSFLTKFKHLCHAGFKATLMITSSDGEASVVLTAGLGQIPPTQLNMIIGIMSSLVLEDLCINADKHSVKQLGKLLLLRRIYFFIIELLINV
jgi:hypothetical protein